jgi:uncharacterized protein (DUF2147 family)
MTMRGRIAVTTLTFATLAMAASAIAAPAPVTGRWLTEGRKAIVEVSTCGDSICGRVVKVLDPRAPKNATDIHNPDESLRKRPIEGLRILSSFEAGKSHWNGRIYDPESGRTYRSELKREGNVLKVKGCWGPFCKTQRWTPAS